MKGIIQNFRLNSGLICKVAVSTGVILGTAHELLPSYILPNMSGLDATGGGMLAGLLAAACMDALYSFRGIRSQLNKPQP